MKRIHVFLPADRTKPGYLHLFDDDGSAQDLDLECLGKADNGRAAAEGNPSRDPTKPYGDTPSGRYERTRIVDFDAPHARMGRAWIPLTGETGDALEAMQRGRTGLGIHAGRGDGRLVPTYGCLRMLDHDFEVLAGALGDEEFRVTIEDLNGEFD